MSSKRKSQPTRLTDQLSTMFPTFPHLKSAESEPLDEMERLKAFQQECQQSLLLHLQQQQQLQQNLSQLNKFMEPGYPAAPQKSMQDTLKCLKSLQLARSLETDTSRYVYLKSIFLKILEKSISPKKLAKTAPIFCKQIGSQIKSILPWCL